MAIEIRDTKEFSADELEDLFLSVEWSSGKYPDKLAVAMRNSDRVYSAWDGGKLVGLINALSDGIMTAYFHYMLVRPEYHSKGIGKMLVMKMLSAYEDYARKVVISYQEETGFYEHCGFKVNGHSVPMFITYLTT
ncbi:MAG: GNAT family N-acetyltransferase [Brevinematales bacterium]|nr:GNAT family N-acetyltransferase [Brevinematales bacterium]